MHNEIRNFKFCLLFSVVLLTSMNPLCFLASAEEDSTVLYQCHDQRISFQELPLPLIHESVRIQYHCVDYAEGKPSFVRGTYSMIGYFEGSIDLLSGVSNLSWFEAAPSGSSSAGSALLQYANLDSARRVTGSFFGDRQGSWLGDNCTRQPNATAADRAQRCLWTPRTTRALVDRLLNRSASGLDHASFSSQRGRSDFCYSNPDDAGSYLYAYSPQECAALGLPCEDLGPIEEGQYHVVRATSTTAREASLRESYLYVGSWQATSGPAAGATGSGIYAAVVADAEVCGLELRGFYCVADSAATVPLTCYPERYTHNPRRSPCAAIPNGGGGGAALGDGVLVAIVVPLVCTAAVAALVLAGKGGCGWLMGAEEDEADRLLREKVAELRVRFRITQADGFVLSSDPAPAWWRPRAPQRLATGRKSVYLHKSGLEAAAHLALWEDFDVDQFDAFCLLLKDANNTGGEASGSGLASLAGRRQSVIAMVAPEPIKGGKKERTPQYEAIRDWLLEVTTGLLDPREVAEPLLPGSEEISGRHGLGGGHNTSRGRKSWNSWHTSMALLTPTRLTSSSSQSERFRFVERLVSKARVWRESESLFSELKVVIQGFMDEVAKQCDERFEEITREPFGGELVALQSPALDLRVRTPKPATPLGTPTAAAAAAAAGVDPEGLCHMLWGVFNDRTEEMRSPSPDAGRRFLEDDPDRTSPTAVRSPMPVEPIAEAARKILAVGRRLSNASSCGGAAAIAAVGDGAFGSWTVGALASPNLLDTELLPSVDGKPEDVVGRQDHPKVGAIRIGEDDRKEARLESAGASTVVPGVLEEEVFVAQLHRRAELLNQGFQDKVAAVVRSHSDEFDGPPPPGSAIRLADGNGNGHQFHHHHNRGSGGGGGGGGRRRMSLWKVGRSNRNVTYTCHFDGGKLAEVSVHTAPVKTVGRMKEKLVEYAAPHPSSMWPLSANIIDPIRLSIVCQGPSQILQVARWFAAAAAERQGSDSPWAGPRSDTASAPMPVCRFKNKFAYPREEVQDGYRDLKIFVIYTGESGLRIIGEIQINDHKLFYLKQKMHKLYKIKRAQRFDLISS